MKENVKALIKDMKAKAEHKKNNGPIDITADQLWKYSGKIEESVVIINKWNSNKINTNVRYYGGYKLHEKRKEVNAKR